MVRSELQVLNFPVSIWAIAPMILLMIVDL